MSFGRLFLVLAGIYGLPARAAGAGVIEARGEATIVSGDLVVAKNAAIADALRHAVEQVVGFTVTSSALGALDVSRVSGSQLDFHL